MQVVSDGPAAGFGYVANPNARFVFDDVSYSVEIAIDASVQVTELSTSTIPELQFGSLSTTIDKKAVFKLPLWRVAEQVAGGGRILRMVIGCHRGTEIHSLAELSKRVHSGTGSEEDLGHLDGVFDQLLAVTDTLHRRNRTIGLLDPGNVFYFLANQDASKASPTAANAREASSQVRLLLPDLPFHPTKGAPNWVVLRQTYDFLWQPEYNLASSSTASDESTRTLAINEPRQRYLLRQTNPQTFLPEMDLRALARMLAWCLTGRRITGPIEDNKLVGGRWDWIRKVLSDAIVPSASSLREELGAAGNRPSGDPMTPVVSKAGGSAGMRWFVRLLTVLFLLGAGLYYSRATLFPKPAPPPTKYAACPDCPAFSSLHQHFLGRQSELIKEFHTHYPDLAGGDDPLLVADVQESGLPASEKVYIDQMDNLKGQLAQIRAGIELIGPGHSAQEKQCIELELARLQAAWVDHFRIVEKRADQLSTIKTNSSLVTGIRELGEEFLKLATQEKLAVSLRTDIPKKLEHLASQLDSPDDMRVTQLFLRTEDAERYLKLIRTYVPRTSNTGSP